MDITVIFLVIAYLLIILLGFIMFWAVTEIKAMQKSTHQVQYVNLPNQDFQKMTDELKQKLTKDVFDNI